MLEKKLSNSHYTLSTEYERSSKVFTRSLINLSKNMKILDVGCGTGLNTSKIKSSSNIIFGIDISEVAIQKYNENGFTGLVCDIENDKVPFEDGYFDLIFASEVLEHIANSDAVLAEFYRLLKPGGQLVLSTPNSAFWIYRILTIFGKTSSELQHPGHLRFFSLRSLSILLKKNNFNITILAGRNMYFVFPSFKGNLALKKICKILNMQIEPRYSTKTFFYQYSSFSSVASSFWSDTIIINAKKINNNIEVIGS